MSSAEDIRDYTMREDETRGNLIIVLSPAGLLMGMKTRGFGAGKLVLPGGKEKFQGPGFLANAKPLLISKMNYTKKQVLAFLQRHLWV